jgi:hypothetical protein
MGIRKNVRSARRAATVSAFAAALVAGDFRPAA